MNMALKKASKPVFRLLSADCNARRTSFRSLTNSVDQGLQRDCLQQSESSKTHRGSNSGTYMRWASALVLSAGLGLLQFPELESDFCNSNEEKQTEGGKNKFILRDSYRRRLFFNYERRIRMRSSPEKVFEYFASIRTPDGELFMTPADLVRAVVPVFPPPDCNILRHGSLRGERSPGELHCPQSELFMRFDTNGDGLISFPEYIFFVTLLSIPESDIFATIKMFDRDRNGEIKKEEFKKVMRFLRANNRQGAAQRDGFRIGLKVDNSVDNGGLVEYFFGKDGKGHLQLRDFEEFVRGLHKEKMLDKQGAVGGAKSSQPSIASAVRDTSIACMFFLKYNLPEFPEMLCSMLTHPWDLGKHPLCPRDVGMGWEYPLLSLKHKGHLGDNPKLSLILSNV